MLNLGSFNLEDFNDFKIVESDVICRPIKHNDSKRVIKRKIQAFLKNQKRQTLIRVKNVEVGTKHVSIQASLIHYCFPRNNNGEYYAVEVGFPTFDFSEEFHIEHGREDVYSYVPINDLCEELRNYAFTEMRKVRKNYPELSVSEIKQLLIGLEQVRNGETVPYKI